MLNRSEHKNLCWGRKANYANGKWIKLARAEDKAAIKYRLDEGFELCFAPIGQHPQSGGYDAGHPWYYYQGGAVPYPKDIIEEIKATGYQGYMREDIAAIAKRQEPQRSESLRKLRLEVLARLKLDLGRYRELARELCEYRKSQKPTPKTVSSCDAIHTNISLKHNHLYNDFAHLMHIDELLSVQPDLFG